MSHSEEGHVYLAPPGTGPITDWADNGRPITINEKGVTEWTDMGRGFVVPERTEIDETD